MPTPLAISPMPTTPIPRKILARQHEIVADFRRAVDQHLADIVAGRATKMLEIRDLAGLLCLHPTHLSNTLRLATGHPPCHYFEARILDHARQLLADTRDPAAAIAARLTYDPSNFGKFFKHFQGCTPKQYRERVWAERREATAETVTI